MHSEFKPQVAAIVENIKRERIANNYSQEYMGLKLGISQNAYSKIELGITSLSIGRLFKIAKILEIDPLKLISDPFSGRNDDGQSD